MSAKYGMMSSEFGAFVRHGTVSADDVLPRGESKEGAAAPSLAVSIREVLRRGRKRNLPLLSGSFLPFLTSRKGAAGGSPGVNLVPRPRRGEGIATRGKRTTIQALRPPYAGNGGRPGRPPLHAETQIHHRRARSHPPPRYKPEYAKRFGEFANTAILPNLF